MRKKNGTSLIFSIVIITLFLIGAAVLSYPAVSSWYNERHQEKDVEGYQEMVDQLDETDYSAYLEAAQNYNQSLLDVGTILSDPFNFDEVHSEGGKYEEILNFADIMATVEIPEIKVNLPIYHGTSEDTLVKGIGHLAGTSLPIGGFGTHCVLTGHTGLPGKSLFTDISKLEIGDVFYIHVMNETLTYQVDDITVILPQDVEKLILDPNKDYVTLLTCTPYGVNDHRLLVRGSRIFPEELPKEEQEIIQQKAEEIKTLSSVEKIEFIAGCIAFILFLIMLIQLIADLAKRRKKKNEE